MGLKGIWYVEVASLKKQLRTDVGSKWKYRNPSFSSGQVVDAAIEQQSADLLPDYEPSVGGVIKALESRWGHENSDPAKVAQVVLRLAASDYLPAHLLIGSDAIQHAGQAEAERWREVSVSTDADAPRSMSALQF
jgi:hypothetical protein